MKMFLKYFSIKICKNYKIELKERDIERKSMFWLNCACK